MAPAMSATVLMPTPATVRECQGAGR